MQNLVRRGNTWFARFHIPRDRWADAGKATGAARGVLREVVRTLRTTDRVEAKRRLMSALGAIQADLDARLRAASLRPLTDWTADWSARARQLRADLQAADNHTIIDGGMIETGDGEEIEVGETERDLLRREVGREAELLEQVRGTAVAEAFYKAATTEHLTLRDGLEAWLEEAARGATRKTIDGHRRVFSELEKWLRERRAGLSLDAMTFPDISRRMAGEFIAYRASKVSGMAVKREATATMGLWRWAVRRGHAEMNPWSDQTAGIKVASRGNREDTKRPFAVAEQVALLRADGSAWAPNGGGYAATLWDALRLGLLTGLRIGELADLRVRDLVEDRTVVSVPRGKTRNARRLVPLPVAAQQVVAMRLADLPDATPDAPLWPELPMLKLTGSRGGKLSDRFRTARPTILPGAQGVDFHSLRRSYATALEAAMNKGGSRINPAVIASLLGQERGTIALDLYSGGAALDVLKAAVADLEERGLDQDVVTALKETMDQRPLMVRFAPVGANAAAS
jgi:integrase